MMKLLFAPVEAIAEMKKKADITKSIIVIALSALFWALAVIIGTKGMMWLPAIIMFIVMIIASLFMGFLLQLTFGILVGKGGYFEGVTVLACSMFAIAAAALVSSILILIPVIGIIISVILMGIAAVISSAAFFRAAKDLFATDYLTVLIGWVVASTALFLGIYMGIGLAMMGTAIGNILPMFSLLG